MSTVCVRLCRLISGSNILFFRVLMLRRKASRTQTELRVEYSHMVNEALEMVNAEFPKEHQAALYHRSQRVLRINLDVNG